MSRALEIAKLLCLSALFVCLVVLAWQIWSLPKQLEPRLARLETGVEQLGGRVDGILKKVDLTVTGNYAATKASLQSTAALIKHTDDFIVDLNANLNGGRATDGGIRQGLVTDVHLLLAGIQQTAQDSGRQLSGLIGTADGQLAELGPAIRKIGNLAETLEKQIEAGSPQARQSFVELNKTLEDVQKLLENPHVVGNLKNLDKITYHLGESAESVDVALRSLRAKLHWIKMALKTVWSAVKLTVPLR